MWRRCHRSNARSPKKLRRLVKSAAPDASEAIKWAQPVYSYNGPFAYLKPFKTHVNFGFWRGVEDIDEAVLSAMVVTAVRLNQEKGDPSRTR
jgi:hypothetical protein